MIQILKDSDTRPWFFLQTAHTTYGMWVMETGHLEHLYYGERITVDSQDLPPVRPLSYREPSLRATPVPTTGNIRRSPWKMSAWRLVRWEREISENLFWKSDLPTEVSPLTLLLIPMKLLL